MVNYKKILGKVSGLQRGFTSGTCAQAASKAAAIMLITRSFINEVSIELKDGRSITLPVVSQKIGKNSSSCSVIKDSGDDNDITNGKAFCSEVCWSDKPGVVITGGKGVGIVTSEGLPVKVGKPAINPNPMRMIKKSLVPLLQDNQGLKVIISVPEGMALAKKTWNPRIGIVNGISIIGTSGIVEPKSSKAYRASISIQLNVLKNKGVKTIYLTPGYVGEGYLKSIGIIDESIVKIGDYWGYALDCLSAKDFDQIFLVGHIGKMSKIASGIFNTHCKYGDARLETIAAFAGAAGADKEAISNLLIMKMAEESVEFLLEKNLMNTFKLLNRRLIDRVNLRLKEAVNIKSIILDLKRNVISEEEVRV